MNLEENTMPLECMNHLQNARHLVIKSFIKDEYNPNEHSSLHYFLEIEKDSDNELLLSFYCVLEGDTNLCKYTELYSFTTGSHKKNTILYINMYTNKNKIILNQFYSLLGMDKIAYNLANIEEQKNTKGLSYSCLCYVINFINKVSLNKNYYNTLADTLDATLDVTSNIKFNDPLINNQINEEIKYTSFMLLAPGNAKLIDYYKAMSFTLDDPDNFELDLNKETVLMNGDLNIFINKSGTIKIDNIKIIKL